MEIHVYVNTAKFFYMVIIHHTQMVNIQQCKVISHTCLFLIIRRALHLLTKHYHKVDLVDSKWICWLLYSTWFVPLASGICPWEYLIVECGLQPLVKFVLFLEPHYFLLLSSFILVTSLLVPISPLSVLSSYRETCIEWMDS